MTKSKKRRAKSIYAKGWATRRKNAAHRASPEGKMAQAIFGDNADASRVPGLAGLVAKEEATAEMKVPPPNNSASVDAIQRTLELNRDEQLFAFMGDLAAAREARRNNGHYPWLVSRPQVEAIEEFLSDHGYSAWGKGLGRFASVSTKPAA